MCYASVNGMSTVTLTQEVDATCKLVQNATKRYTLVYNAIY